MEQKPKRPKPERLRSKVSFAIDRDEIDISTEWVQAVMDRPASPPDAKNTTVAVSEAVAESQAGLESATDVLYDAGAKNVPVEELDLDLGVVQKDLSDNSTVVNNATVAESETALPVAVSYTHDTLLDNATVVSFATGVSLVGTGPFDKPALQNRATVVLDSPVVANGDSTPVPADSSLQPESLEAESATVALSDGGHPPSAPMPGQTITRQVTTVGKTATVVASATVVVTYENQTSRQFRPRPIRGIADGLTPGQMAVYHLMFQGGEARDAEGRLYQGGYADLCAMTGMSKRGIQNVIADLKAKTCIDVHQQPGYHRSQMTTYRVFSEATILNTWRERGIQYAIGKGKELVVDPGKPESGWAIAAS